jgi:hypothetical protein
MKTKKYTFVNVADAMEGDIIEDIVYIDRINMVASLHCPCGCAAIIQLNLIPGVSPCWSISENTIKPSINRIVGCKSHFSIINGIVQ